MDPGNSERATGPRSVATPPLNVLADAVVTGAEREQLDPFRPCLERADHVGRHADRVHRLELEDLLVELDAARAGQHDVHLLGALVPVPEGRAPSREQTLEADPGALSLAGVFREPCLLSVADPELWS